MTSIFVSIVVLFSHVVTADQSKVDRQDYFKTAFGQMSFILGALNDEEKFQELLNPEEKKMLQGIMSVAEQNATFHWMNKNTLSNVFEKQKIFYYLVSEQGSSFKETENKDIYKSYTTPAQFNLQFSDKKELFQLKTGEPERSAMTYSPTKKAIPDVRGIEADVEDIYVNINRISNENSKITFTDAISILIHEFGHKLSEQKNQIAVDSLSAKAKVFIDENFKKEYKNENGRFYLYQIPFYFLQDWAGTFHKGVFQGLNGGFKFNPLNIYNDSGAYLFFESSNEVKNLSNQLFKSSYKETLKKNFDTEQVKWNFLELNEISDIDFAYQDKKVNLSYKLRSSYQPILLPSTDSKVDVSQFDSVTHYFNTATAHNLSMTESYKVSLVVDQKSSVNVVKAEKLKPIRNRPEIEVIFVSEDRSGDALNIEYKIKDLNTRLENFKNTEAQVMLMLKDTHGQTYEFIGQHSLNDKDLDVIFKLNNFYKTNLQLTSAHIDVIETRNNFTDVKYFSRIRLSMNKPLVISSNGQVSNAYDQFFLKSIKQDKELVKKSAPTPADFSELVLYFNSQTKINHLKLKLQAPILSKKTIKINYGAESQETQPFISEKTSIETEVIFEQKNMVQKLLKSNLLEVRLKIDKQVGFDSDISQNILEDFEFGRAITTTETENLRTVPRWSLISVVATNEDFKMTDFHFKRPDALYSKKHSERKRTSHSVMKCSALFQF